eukprot:SM001956S05482  [mRNA]  locus=s1956:941:1797:- [translate_table: standard]
MPALGSGAAREKKKALKEVADGTSAPLKRRRPRPRPAEDTGVGDDAALAARGRAAPGSSAAPARPYSGAGSRTGDQDLFQFDPELRASFGRNIAFLRRVFSLDTLFSPLPPAVGQSLARNFGFFGRIFTQFFDPRGIRNVQKSIGLREDEARAGSRQR